MADCNLLALRCLLFASQHVDTAKQTAYDVAMSILTWAPQGPLLDRPFGKDRKGQERISGALKNEFLQKSTKMLKIT